MERKLKCKITYSLDDGTIICLKPSKSKRVALFDDLLKAQKEIKHWIKSKIEPVYNIHDLTIVLVEELWNEIGDKLIKETTKYYYSLEDYLENE